MKLIVCGNVRSLASDSLALIRKWFWFAMLQLVEQRASGILRLLLSFHVMSLRSL